MSKGKTDGFLFVVAIVDIINTAVQWFGKISSFGWSPYIWLGIGILVFMVLILALVIIDRRFYTKREKVQNTHSDSVTKSISNAKSEISQQSLDVANRKIAELTDKLKPFWELRNGQLQNLKYSNSALIMTKLESIQFHGLKNP